MELSLYAIPNLSQLHFLLRGGALRAPAVFIQTDEADAQKLNDLLKRLGAPEIRWEGPSTSSPEASAEK